MAHIISTAGAGYMTINIKPESVNVDEGHALNLSGALANTEHVTADTAHAVPVGIVVTPLTDGKSAYGRATGQAVEVALGHVLVSISSADTEVPADFNSTNYAAGKPVGFVDGKYTYRTTGGSPATTVSRRGVVVKGYTIGTTYHALVLVDKVNGS